MSDSGKGAAPDSAELAKRFAELAERSQRLVADFLARQGEGEAVGLSNPMAIGAAFFAMTARLMADPQKLVEAQTALWSEYIRLWQHTAERLLGGNSERLIEAAPEDRRFRDQAWSDNALFDFIKQSY